MAVAVGSTLLSSDMQSWYTRLNAVTNKFGGGNYAALTVPSAGKIVQTSDLKNIVTRFNTIKSDKFLGADVPNSPHITLDNLAYWIVAL